MNVKMAHGGSVGQAVTCRWPCAPCGAGGPRSTLPELARSKKMLHVVEEWLRRERQERQLQQAATKATVVTEQEATIRPNRTPDMPLKHLMFFR